MCDYLRYDLQTPLRVLTQLFRLFPLMAPHGGVPDTAYLKHTSYSALQLLQLLKKYHRKNPLNTSATPLDPK